MVYRYCFVVLLLLLLLLLVMMLVDTISVFFNCIPPLIFQDFLIYSCFTYVNRDSTCTWVAYGRVEKSYLGPYASITLLIRDSITHLPTIRPRQSPDSIHILGLLDHINAFKAYEEPSLSKGHSVFGCIKRTFFKRRGSTCV